MSMHLSRCEKKHGLLIDLSKFSKIKRHYVFFQNDALRAELCDFVSAHNSGSPALSPKFEGNVFSSSKG